MRWPLSARDSRGLRRLQMENRQTCPRRISNLRNLESLEATNCCLFPLPEELDALSRLTKLDLSYNLFADYDKTEGEIFPAAARGRAALAPRAQNGAMRAPRHPGIFGQAEIS